MMFSILISLGLMFVFWTPIPARAQLQQPTVSIPTVTGTPEGPTIRVNADNDQINVRTGPNTDYDAIGVMIAGETAPALGRSVGGDWIKIVYPGVEGGVGWVYSPLVTLLDGSELEILEPPPTPTPRITPTIDPTLASQFIVEVPATRLPTFTAPQPLNIPTYEPPAADQLNFGVPMGLVIVALGIVGILGAFFSFLRGN